MKTDVAIIGGGIMGCATAFNLAKLGVGVTVIEKNPAVGLEASGRCACGVRQQGRTGGLQLSMASVRLWADLSKELDFDVEYTRTGNLKIALSQQEAAELEEKAAWEHAQELTEVKILTPDECRELVPGITKDVVAGKFCPTDGIANPMLVTPAFARAAIRSGAKILTHTSVTGLLQQGSDVVGVSTDQGEIQADLVINAAGPWAARFNQMAGCHTPIEPNNDTLIITERQQKRITPFTSFGFWWGYILQPRSGNIVIGLESEPIDDYRKDVDLSAVAMKARDMIGLFPYLKHVSIIRTLAGITEITPDKESYIGPLRGVSGYLSAAGFSGQGFCLGPIVGKIMAELATGKEPSLSLDPFKPDRFAKDFIQ